MKKRLRWIKLTTVWVSDEIMDANALLYAQEVEQAAKAKHLYFSRYSGVTLDKGHYARTEIRLLTAEPEDKFRQVWLGTGDILGATAEPCDAGSLAHSFGYQVAKQAGLADKSPWFLADVFHWICNMCGLSYADEIQMHCDVIKHFTRQKADQEVLFKRYLFSSQNTGQLKAPAPDKAGAGQPGGFRPKTTRRAGRAKTKSVSILPNSVGNRRGQKGF